MATASRTSIMFDPELVRFICGKLAVEDDPERLRKLAEILRFVASMDAEKKSGSKKASLRNISEKRAA